MSVVNLFDLDIPYIDVQPVDYQRLLDSCDPEALKAQHGSIFPQASFEESDMPKLPKDFNFDKAFSL